MITILFVDDEPSILQGIRRTSRSMRAEWSMHFCESGPAALAFVRENPVDVIVSDMRMPGMDGAELLTEVRRIQPGCARIVLSGYAEEQAVFRSTRVAHQFLSKPCKLEELADTIQRIQRVRARVEPEVVRDLVGKIDQLPALGNVYSELMMEIESDSSSSNTLSAIVSKDVALTAQLLRLVNSTFFGLSRDIGSVAQAIGFLGVDVVRAIVAGHSLFDNSADSTIDVDAVAHRAHVTAGLARQIAKLNDGSPTDCAESYLAGMLHEIGALALAGSSEVDTEVIRGVLESRDGTNERLEFGVDRFIVGSYLLGLWGFSPTVTDAISALSETSPEATSVVGVALSKSLEITSSRAELPTELTEELVTALLDDPEADVVSEPNNQSRAA